MTQCTSCGGQFNVHCKHGDETWQEMVQRVGELHKEKVKQFGVKKAGRAQRGWSLNDSAKLHKISRDSMIRIWKLYQGIGENPNIYRIQSMKSALVYLKRIIGK